MSDFVQFKSFEDENKQYWDARTTLPAPMLPRSQISVWSLLKNSIGKDLSKITMPVVFNEPLTFIERLAEYMQYVYLIEKAALCADPVKRLEYVVAFAISAVAGNQDRVRKPFNPLLGETYELDCLSELGFRIVLEQVSHHPPVAAYAAEGPLFRYEGSCYPRLRFYGRSVDIKPIGTSTLTLLPHEETYTWTYPNCSIHNLVMGDLYVEHHGVVEIINHTLGLKAVLTVKSGTGWFWRDASHMEGYILDKNENTLRYLYGDWAEFMASCDEDSFDFFPLWVRKHKEYQENLRKQRSKSFSEEPQSSHTVIPLLAGSDVLWRATPRPPQSRQYYSFTAFATMLNEHRNKDPKHADLPPTDSRFRLDMKCLENGEIDEACDEKHRLEEKQRAARAARRKTKFEWKPRWFREEQHPILTDETVWKFTNKYWQRDWSSCPDIF